MLLSSKSYSCGTYSYDSGELTSKSQVFLTWISFMLCGCFLKNLLGNDAFIHQKSIAKHIWSSSFLIGPISHGCFHKAYEYGILWFFYSYISFFYSCASVVILIGGYCSLQSSQMGKIAGDFSWSATYITLSSNMKDSQQVNSGQYWLNICMTCVHSILFTFNLCPLAGATFPV